MDVVSFTEHVKNSSRVLAIDFDGVIHDDNKGFHDGTIYGNPIEGANSSLKFLSERYTVVLYTCKANPDRPLVEGKTGIELIWEWLDKQELKEYVTDIVWGKPNAFAYIDDKGVKFNNWSQALHDLNQINYESRD